MKSIFVISTLLLNIGCVATNIEVQTAPQITNVKNIKVQKLNELPHGMQCFEPMLYVFSIGIIPTHCVNDYKVYANDKEIASVEVTSMQGWIPLIMGVFPNWDYGYPDNIEVKIKDIVTVK